MADDYGKIKRALMLIYRKVRYKTQYMGKHVAEGSDGNKIIYDWICEGKPGMVGRLGAVESRFIASKMCNRIPSKKNLNDLNLCAGVFPLTIEMQQTFYSEYTNALSQTDIFVAWSVHYGGKLYKHFCSNALLIGFYALEPFFYSEPWTYALRNKRVLVVHPFIDSIKKQYDSKKKIFNNTKMNICFKQIIYLKAIQSNAGNDSKISYQTWNEALNIMKAQISNLEFDIAIIGAGSYGLPLAAYVKSLGKQAIHTAGVTQMIFGISGKRWDKDPLYKDIINENWIHPSKEETPDQINRVEGGTYW